MPYKIPKGISHFSKALRYVFDSSGWLTVINFVLTFIQSIFPLLLIYLIKELIDSVGIAVNSPDKDLAFMKVKWVVLITGIVFLINALSNTVSQYVREYQAQVFSDYMYGILHKKAVSLDLGFFENSTYHDIFFRALQDSPQRPLKIVSNLFYIIQYLLAVIILSVLLISLHWSIAIALIVATVPGGLLRLYYAEKQYRWQKENTQNERKAYYFSRILTGEVFAKELRLFGLQEYFTSHFTQLRNALRNGKIGILRPKTFYESLSQILAAIAIFTTYGIIAYKSVYGTLGIGALVMYFMAIQRGTAYFKELLNSFTSMYEDSLYITNLNAFLNLENKREVPAADLSFPVPVSKGIELKNVSFSYPGSQREALRNINMFIKPGSAIALVGDNGAGKTTLVKLLCHLYEADSGEILIDGININSINDTEIKSNISVLFQDYVLYHLTVKENIAFGNINNIDQQERLKQAAEKAGISELIATLKNQYDTILGKLFDGSEELSIGEWQKLAMARAFFKDAPVIILDEPTSALDPKAEFEVFKQFKEITKGKTTVLVSHRFSTVKLADYIYVMEKETIIEQGTHESLMQLNGKYAGMFTLQANNYN